MRLLRQALGDYDRAVDGFDVWCGTTWRDWAVYRGAYEHFRAIPVASGDPYFDIPFFSGNIAAALTLGFGWNYMQRRNANLQKYNDEYFIQKMIYLSRRFSNVNLEKDEQHIQYLRALQKFTGPNKDDPCKEEPESRRYLEILQDLAGRKDLASALYYFGDPVIGPNQLFRRLFNKESPTDDAARLLFLANQKKTLVHQIIQLINEDIFSAARKKAQEDMEAVQLEQANEEKARKALIQKSLRSQIEHALFQTGDILWTSLTKYMMAYWLLWFAVWGGLGLTAVTGVAAIGLFAPPLIPVIFYLVARFTASNAPDKADWKYNYHRKIFLNSYFSGLQDKLNQQLRSSQIKDLADEKICAAIKATNLAVSDYMNDETSITEITIKQIKNSKNRALVTTVLSGFMVGLILTEFGAWPVVAFLGVVGVAAAGGPLTVALVAGIALAIGLYMACYGAHQKNKQCNDQIKILKNKSSELDTLVRLEKENKCLERKLDELYVRAKAEGFAPEVFKPIKAQPITNRVLRRMTFDSSHLTGLKKALHVAYVAVARCETGILLIRLFFGVGCLFALSNPMIFIGLMTAVGTLWAGYKIYEHFKTRKDSRNDYFLRTSNVKLDAETRNNKFLREQYTRKILLFNHQKDSREVRNSSESINRESRALVV